MLIYEEDEGIIWITPMLESEVLRTREKVKDIIATIDDCDCQECSVRRGLIGIDSNIMLKLPMPEGGSVVQRLSLQEAKMLGSALVAYAENLEMLSGDLHGEDRKVGDA